MKPSVLFSLVALHLLALIQRKNVNPEIGRISLLVIM
jgi:hypothetical protein